MLSKCRHVWIYWTILYVVTDMQYFGLSFIAVVFCLSFRCAPCYSISVTVSSDTELRPFWHSLISSYWRSSQTSVHATTIWWKRLQCQLQRLLAEPESFALLLRNRYCLIHTTHCSPTCFFIENNFCLCSCLCVCIDSHVDKLQAQPWGWGVSGAWRSARTAPKLPQWPSFSLRLVQNISQCCNLILSTFMKI